MIASPESSIGDTTPPPSESHGGPGKYFLLHVFLQNGRNLAIKDASGSSDPYVKFYYKKKLIYRSNTVYKNVSPQWDEKFMHVIDDITQPLRIEVYDYDRLSNDDFMGSASVDLFKLDSNPVETKVQLVDKKNSNNNGKDLGFLTLSMQVLPAAEGDSVESLRNRHTSESSTKASKRVRKGSKTWTDLVRIVLIEARNFVTNNKTNSNGKYSENNPPDTVVKFKLGEEKCKSKIIFCSWKPQWLEQFSMHTSNDQNHILEVVLMNLRKDVPIGRCSIDLTLLPSRKVEKRWYRLDNGISEILLSLAYSGKLASRTVSAADTGDGLIHRFDESATPDILRSYRMISTFRDIWNVGFLVVRVHKARDLAGADLINSSDPFCVVELNNARLETHTEERTKNPEWYTVFTFFVSDIHSVMDITIYDEDRYKKAEFLGKVGIPLLNIKSGEQVWYQLKNQHLTRRAKGEILLEMSLVYNPIRAGIATCLPQEPKYGIKEDKFSPKICFRNLERLNRFVILGYDSYQLWLLCLSWENPGLSLLGLMGSLIAVFLLQPYMIPLGLLGVFGIIYYKKVETGDFNPDDPNPYSEEEIEEMEEEDSVTDEKNWKVIRSYIRYKEVSLWYMQNTMDITATFIEKAKNILEFKQPFVSWLTILFLVIGVIVMYCIPLRYLAMLWVIKKFTRMIRRPHTVPSNEVLDFIAHAPSDIDLKSYYGYKRDSVADSFINKKILAYADQRKRNKTPKEGED